MKTKQEKREEELGSLNPGMAFSKKSLYDKIIPNIYWAPEIDTVSDLIYPCQTN